MSSEQDIFECDILVVGGGLSGLTAAYRAQQRWPEDRIKVIEAKDRIGGRLFSVSLNTDQGSDVWDLGGSWVGKTQTEILDLLGELGLETYPQYFKGDKFIQVGSNNQVKTYQSSIPKLNLVSLLDLAMFLRKLESDRKRTHFDRESMTEDNELLDSITAQAYANRHIWTKSVMEMTQAAIRTVTGTELSHLSGIFLMDYANAAGSFEDLIESSPDSGQGMKIKGGAQSVCHKLAEKIGHENIFLSKAVETISYNDHSVTVKVKSTFPESALSIFRAKFVIMAIPPTLMKLIEFSPPLPATKTNLFNAYRPGHIIKVVLTYRIPFWRELGFSGEIVTNGGPSFNLKCSTGPLCITFDATTDSGSPALVAFIGGRQAEEYDDLTSDERKDAVIKSLEQFLPSESVNEYVTYAEKNWRLDRYCGGSPIAVLSCGAGHLTKHSRTPIGNSLFFCGSEFATHWTGFMCGAVQSANLAVDCLHSSRLHKGTTDSDVILEKSKSDHEQTMTSNDEATVITARLESPRASIPATNGSRGFRSAPPMRSYSNDADDETSVFDPSSTHATPDPFQDMSKMSLTATTVNQEATKETNDVKEEQTQILGKAETVTADDNIQEISEREIQSSVVIDEQGPSKSSNLTELEGSKALLTTSEEGFLSSTEVSLGDVLSQPDMMNASISSDVTSDECTLRAVEDIKQSSQMSLADELSNVEDPQHQFQLNTNGSRNLTKSDDKLQQTETKSTNDQGEIVRDQKDN